MRYEIQGTDKGVPSQGTRLREEDVGLHRRDGGGYGKVKGERPGSVWRDYAFCGPHYNECFARMDVAAMRHKGKAGEHKGEHWNMEQVATAIKGMSIPGNTNIWDVYVALNANWHDKEVKFSEWFGPDAEKKIIDDAINFYFLDDDAPEGKVWIYMCAMDD